MSLRAISTVALVLLTTGCLGPVRLEGPLPRSMGSVEIVKRIEVTNELDQVVLRGEFSEPKTSGNVTSRAASLEGSDGSASGSAILEVRPSGEGHLLETLNLEVEGLWFPSLYHVLVDQGEVTVFSTTASGHARLSLRRGADSADRPEAQ